ncbi:MAG: threonine synthase [bacterium]|nr:threonine synthase [bacterium]
MNLISTRGDTVPTPIHEAIARGLAPDGGLYVPTALPRLELEAFAGASTLPEVATALLQPFFAGSPLAPELAAMCRDALAFHVPLVAVDHQRDTRLLELFHGPTAAFKDVGARFLAACFARLPAPGNERRTILVATSGDTGGAVADAFFQRDGFDVVILYPNGLVAPRQAHLLSCYGENVRTFRVAGTFDDCQRLAKQAFRDTELTAALRLTSANSISAGRLLPQMSYYAHSALTFWREHGERLNYVIPTGNLGNALACLWAREIGLPIGDVVLATNSNRVLPEHFAGGDYTPHPSVATIANAMDVGDPSNFERLAHLWPAADERRQRVSAYGVHDDALRARIRTWSETAGVTICPHTAAAAEVRERELGDEARPWCVVATAHPAKFESVVEPIIGRAVPVPPPLENLLARQATDEPLAPEFEALRQQLRADS